MRHGGRQGAVARQDDRDFEPMTKLANGDETALQELIDRHGPAVFGLARRIVGDPHLAEEVLQDAFLKLAREGREYRASTAGALPWLLTIARNAAVDLLRRRKRDRQTAHS